MKFDAFVGPAYKARSLAVSAQRALNLYVEADESHGETKASLALMGAPGISLFGTLPTTPVRGIWTGLIDALPGSTGSDLCYAVGGSKLYSVASNGATTLIGDLGDDAAHSPVQFQVNGDQILISSAGLAWVYDATGLSQAFFNNGWGALSTVGTAVTWVSGDQFDSTLVGSGILIAGVAYVISAYVDSTHITLSSSAGTQTAVAYSIFGGANQVSTSGTAVTGNVGVNGDSFIGLAGQKVVINGVLYTVLSVTDATHLTLTSSAGTQTAVEASTPRAVLAAQVSFLDTYGIALPPNSKYYFISTPGNFRLWNPLDFAQKSGFPDAIACILADHEDLWLFGTETTEVWRDTGNADFPFERDPGAFIHQGIRAPFSAVNLANGVAWLGGDIRGGAPIAWRSTGYTPVRVSTHAIESIWGGYSTTTDAIAYVYTEDGHQFWCISFPTANATWVYDATAGLWHERGWWSGTTDNRQRQAYHSYAFGKHICGDWQNGKLYQQSLSIYGDEGATRHFRRQAPHLTNEEDWTFYSRFRLSMQAGPSPTLQWADDLGVTFNTARAAQTRRLGATSQSSEWRRLGRGRDRVYAVDILDATHQIAIDACYIDASPGNG